MLTRMKKFKNRLKRFRLQTTLVKYLKTNSIVHGIVHFITSRFLVRVGVNVSSYYNLLAQITLRIV